MVYVKGTTNNYDWLVESGKTLYGQKTVAELEQEHPGKIFVGSFEEIAPMVMQATVDKYCNPVIEEISEEDYFEAFEALPPAGMSSCCGVMIFYFSEFKCGNVSTHFARYNDRFFKANREVKAGEYYKLAQEVIKHVA